MMKKIIISVLTLSLMIGCSDYAEINTDIYGATKEDKKKDGLLYGAPFQRLQQLVIPIGSPAKDKDPENDLQNTDLISSGNYIGYFGNNNSWNSEIEATWNFPDNRMSYAFRNFYSNTFKEWQSIKESVGNSTDLRDKRVLALANVLKITTWLRATDVFGPIVYKNAGNGDITPSLDSQEEVYKAMLVDLEEAVNVLNGGSSLLEEYDAIYNGNVSKWVKFTNSLMLRIAVRTHFKAPELADKYIRKALAGGVMMDVADEAKIQNSSKMPLKNSMTPSVIAYNESRMGETIALYLKGYKDPRIQKYFTEARFGRRKGFFGVLPAWSFSKVTYSNSPFDASKPNVDDNSPLYWMRTSEVLFLKAEAALYNLGGLNSAQAKSFYEEGIKMSFKENEIKSGVDIYLESTDLPSSEENVYLAYLYGTSYSYKISTNNVSPNWEDAFGDQEKELQKIITQKYLAMYPNAVEAWTEYRRTGYPFVMPPVHKNARDYINCPTCFVPERFKYSANEYSTNPKMQTEVPTLLGGEDTGGTRLWWVRSDRPNQN